MEYCYGAEVTYVSCPPDLKHQEGALVSQVKIRHWRIFTWETRAGKWVGETGVSPWRKTAT